MSRSLTGEDLISCPAAGLEEFGVAGGPGRWWDGASRPLHMHLRFTEEELGVLIDMVSLAAEVGSLNRRPGAKEQYARFEELENTILEKVTHLGFGDIIEFDESQQRYRVTTDYLTKSFVQESLDEMRNEIFWEELTLRLAERDVIRKIGLPAWNSLDEETRRAHTEPIEKSYWEEFTKRGIDTLHLIARFETG